MVVLVKNDKEDRPQGVERRLGLRVRELRTARGWTQKALAQRASALGFTMHRTTVAKVESGTRPTSVAEVAALAAIFDVEVHHQRA